MIAWSILALAGCSLADETTPDTGTGKAGHLTLALATADTAVGASVIVVSGGPVTAVSVPAQYQVVTRTDAAGTHLLFTGDLGRGVIATLAIPDRNRAAAYVATIESMADRRSFRLVDPATAAVTIVPVVER